MALHSQHRSGEANFFLEGFYQGCEITARATAHHSPLGPVLNREEPVIAKETHKKLQRKVEHLFCRHRPDCRTHRYDVVLDEALAITALAQVFAQSCMLV